MKIYLVRHAKIVTPNEIVQSPNDPIVSDEQTIKLCNKVQNLVPHPEKIYCSELERAVQTTKLIYPDRKDVTITSSLNEYVRPSRLIGKNKNELRNFWGENAKNKYNVDWKPEDGESYSECVQRANLFHKTLMDDKRLGINSISVIGHGTIFRHLICALTGVPEWKTNPHIIIDLLRRFEWGNLEVKTVEI